MAPADRDAWFDDWQDRCDAWEDLVRRGLIAHVDRAERVAVEKLTGRKVADRYAKTLAGTETKGIDPRIIFDPSGWFAQVLADLTGWLRQIAGHFSGRVKTMLGGRPDDWSDRGRAALDKTAADLAELTRGLADDLAARIDQTIADGQRVADSLDRISERLRDDFEVVRRDRVPLTAETIVPTAARAGEFLAAQDAGIEMDKTWMSRLDDRVRPAHRAAHGQTVGLNDRFEVGGHGMLFPGDPTAPLHLTVRCRCIAVYAPVMALKACWVGSVADRGATVTQALRAAAVKALDGDGDGMVDDGTPFERPDPNAVAKGRAVLDAFMASHPEHRRRFDAMTAAMSRIRAFPQHTDSWSQRPIVNDRTIDLGDDPSAYLLPENLAALGAEGFTPEWGADDLAADIDRMAREFEDRLPGFLPDDWPSPDQAARQLRDAKALRAAQVARTSGEDWGRNITVQARMLHDGASLEDAYAEWSFSANQRPGAYAYNPVDDLMSAWRLERGLRLTPPDTVTEPLYRGQWMPSDKLPEAGDTIDMAVVSFSRSEQTATAFAGRENQGGRPVVFELPAGARGLDAADRSVRGEREVVLGGRFRVVSVTDDGTRLHAVLTDRINPSAPADTVEWVRQPPVPVAKARTVEGMTVGTIGNPDAPVVAYRGLVQAELASGAGKHRTGWQSGGGFNTVAEGRTNVGLDPDEIAAVPKATYTGALADSSPANDLLVAVDVRGLPYRTAAPADGGTIAPSFAVGLGIEGVIPFDRILSVRRITPERTVGVPVDVDELLAEIGGSR